MPGQKTAIGGYLQVIDYAVAFEATVPADNSSAPSNMNVIAKGVAEACQQLSATVNVASTVYPALVTLANQAVASSAQIISMFASSTAPDPPTVNTIFRSEMDSAVKAYAAYWAAEVLMDISSNGCPGTSGFATSFQQAYNRGYGASIPVSGQYDTPTIAAINVIYPGMATPCTAGLPPKNGTSPGPAPSPKPILPGPIFHLPIPAPTPTPTPAPITIPVSVTTTPATTSSTPIVIGAVLAMGALGWMVYALRKAKPNPIEATPSERHLASRAIRMGRFLATKQVEAHTRRMSFDSAVRHFERHGFPSWAAEVAAAEYERIWSHHTMH